MQVIDSAVRRAQGLNRTAGGLEPARSRDAADHWMPQSESLMSFRLGPGSARVGSPGPGRTGRVRHAGTV